jgi:hypothetical protein
MEFSASFDAFASIEPSLKAAGVHYRPFEIEPGDQHAM